MKKLILSLLFALTLNVNLQSQCTGTANFTYSVDPTNSLKLTFTADNNGFPVGSFNFTYDWYVFSTLTSTINPSVITFTGSGTYKIKLFMKACCPIGGQPIFDDTTMFITVTDGITTGIKDYTPNIEFNAFPNPTNGIINIKLTENYLEKKYAVINTLGQYIMFGEFKDLNEKIDLSTLSSGIYFITCEKKVVKIMKN